MATSTKAERRGTHDLSRSQLLAAYRTMRLSRRLDDKEIQLKRQNKIFFQISGAGHEAVLTAAGMVLKPGYDWFFLYYRDRALCLELGLTPAEMLESAVGAAVDPNSGGRQMPSHWGKQESNIVSVSSPTGTQFLQAVGSAEATMRARLLGVTEGFEKDEVVLVTAGDGTTSEGEFWESLNTASNLKLPIVYLIEDNGYAISVPVEVNTAGGSISKLVASFPDLFIQEVDGCDFVASHAAMQKAVEYARKRKGPALVHAHVIRPYSHSLSDNEVLYRPPQERDAEAAIDPVTRYPEWLVAQGHAGEKDIARINEEVEAEVLAATDHALAQAQPGADTVYRHVYSEDVDPTSEQFDTEDDPQFSGNETTMVDLLNSCLKDEMRRNPKVVVFGEDVADVSRDEYIDQVKGKGGVFMVTLGLQKEFGSDRVFNTPLAEANIVGRAVGMAVRGLKPVAEIQFFDYIWPAYQQIRNELATFRWRSNGAFSAPAVIRMTYGGYIRGAIYHSQAAATLFTHCPGLRVACPATALDAAGLLRTAIRCDDPVMFLEHKNLYRQTFNKAAYPGPNFMIPFGKAKVVREGTDLTLVTYGATVHRAFTAANQVAEEGGPSVEVIDLRTLSPWDRETVFESVKKTSRVIVGYEDPMSWGYGAELAAAIADECFAWLDAPVKRVAGTDTFVGYAPQLEDAILPQVEDFKRAFRDVARF
ncbi:MAG TPA: dehydrogenase E1 component subunit alpha/beta [Gemmatimonadaceae bacterium]|jgi:2-oxoisovalerate dehydrogenase E1 component|nr:dehydrogenase E1 component subunit alpha/beta [Gemmatimonadaceae bacterium]